MGEQDKTPDARRSRITIEVDALIDRIEVLEEENKALRSEQIDGLLELREDALRALRLALPLARLGLVGPGSVRTADQARELITLLAKLGVEGADAPLVVSTVSDRTGEICGADDSTPFEYTTLGQTCQNRKPCPRHG